MQGLQEITFQAENKESKESGAGIMEIKGPKSRFVKVRCEKCKNEQVIFGKPVTIVKCLVCGEVLAEPKGSKANIKARVLEVLS